MSAAPTEIPQSLRKYGNTLTLLKREGKVALYELSRGRHGIRGYEVVIIQTKPAGILFGKWQPGGEFLPSTSAWGQSGWSFTPSELARAEEKFASSCKRYNLVVRKLKRIIGARPHSPEPA